MAYGLFVAAIYAFGVVGFAGCTLLWVRIWQLLAQGRAVTWWRKDFVTRLCVLVVIPLATFCVLALVLETGPDIFRCLTESRCGPNLAGGLINLAIFGLFYAGVELLFLIAKFSSVIGRWFGLPGVRE